jgi:Sulfotransferase family
MRNLLERSDSIAIARENHFMGHLFGFPGARQQLRRQGDLYSDATIKRIVDAIYGHQARAVTRWRDSSIYWNWLTSNVSREELERCLLVAERTERGLFTTFMRIYAEHRGRPIMGEKTPAHLAYVDTLLEWYPGARVIHMLRDPRAVFVSDLRRRRRKARRPYSWLDRIPGLLATLMALQTTLVWRDAARRHERYKRTYPGRYMLVRFEDLVTNPEKSLASVFEFLGVAMPDDLGQVKVYASGFNVGQEGIDAGAVDRWRSQIGWLAKSWLRLVLGRRMRRLGYSR